jgi:hypothetical protein
VGVVIRALAVVAGWLVGLAVAVAVITAVTTFLFFGWGPFGFPVGVALLLTGLHLAVRHARFARWA